MHRWRRLAVIGPLAVAAAVSAGAAGLAATQAAHPTHAVHTNYRGPARTAPAVRLAHGTNFQRPARQVMPRSAMHISNRSNRPASAQSRKGAQR